MNLRKFSTLQIALGFSIAVHAVLLTVRFVDPEAFNRVFEDTPLEVVLVNARSNEKAEKAQAIAQFALAGGGEAAKGRATSPLPPSALTEVGDAVEEEALRKKVTQQLEGTLKDLKEELDGVVNRVTARRNAASWSNCWPRLSDASTRKTPALANATSARLRGKRFMLFTTTACAARLKTRARRTSRKPVAKSSMAS